MGFLLVACSGGVGGGLYLLFLGERLDYAGHFFAGFGGTLMVMALVLEIPSERLNISREALLLVALVLCIAVGAVEEATTFRLAKFDEVDFFNQSLGAVLAGLSLLRGEEERQPPFLALFALSILFLGAGFYYAFR